MPTDFITNCQTWMAASHDVTRINTTLLFSADPYTLSHSWCGVLTESGKDRSHCQLASFNSYRSPALLDVP